MCCCNTTLDQSVHPFKLANSNLKHALPTSPYRCWKNPSARLHKYNIQRHCTYNNTSLPPPVDFSHSSVYTNDRHSMKENRWKNFLSRQSSSAVNHTLIHCCRLNKARRTNTNYGHGLLDRVLYQIFRSKKTKLSKLTNFKHPSNKLTSKHNKFLLHKFF